MQALSVYLFLLQRNADIPSPCGRGDGGGVSCDAIHQALFDDLRGHVLGVLFDIEGFPDDHGRWDDLAILDPAAQGGRVGRAFRESALGPCGQGADVGSRQSVNLKPCCRNWMLLPQIKAARYRLSSLMIAPRGCYGVAGTSPAVEMWRQWPALSTTYCGKVGLVLCPTSRPPLCGIIAHATDNTPPKPDASPPAGA